MWGWATGAHSASPVPSGPTWVTAHCPQGFPTLPSIWTLVVSLGPRSLQSPAWGESGDRDTEPALYPVEARGAPGMRGPILDRGQPLVIANCRADRPSAWPSAQALAQPLSGVQELRMVRPRAVSGEWWVTFEHRYQTVLESSQEIQHCPVRCPQRPRCAWAQSRAAPTGQAG